MNMELLLCMVCLNPTNSLSTYDNTKLLRYVAFYRNKFSVVKLIVLEYQLNNYILNVALQQQI